MDGRAIFFSKGEIPVVSNLLSIPQIRKEVAPEYRR